MRESILSDEISVFDTPLFSHAISVGFVSVVDDLMSTVLAGLALGLLANDLSGPEEGGQASASICAKEALGTEMLGLTGCLAVTGWFEISLSAKANLTVLSLARIAESSSVSRW